MDPNASVELPMPGEEASEDTELGNLVCVLAENKDTAGDSGLDEMTDWGDCGVGLGG